MLLQGLKRWKRKAKYLTIKLLRIKDNTHSIALGFSLGLSINFVPSVGVGPILSVAFAKLCRGNPIAGFLGGMSIIWAFPFLFYLNVVVGQCWLPQDPIFSIMEEETIVYTSLFISKAFIIGMFTNMVLVGLVMYLFIFALISKYRQPLLRYIYKSWLPQK